MGKIIPSETNTVECPSCGWQGASHATDAGHCPECDDECLSLKEIEEMFPNKSPQCQGCDDPTCEGYCFD